jgi:hypothetical protein
MQPSSDPPRKPPNAQEAPAGLEEEIRHRAHELYEQRGRVNGNALDDWLQAQAEVLAERSRATAA